MAKSRDKTGRRSAGEYLLEATTEELLEELTHRRKDALMDCSTQDIERELAKRPGACRDRPPKLVEK